MTWHRRTFLSAALGVLCHPAHSLPASAPPPEKAPDRLFNAPLHLLAPNGAQANLRAIVEGFERRYGVPVGVRYLPDHEVNTRLLEDHLLGRADYDLALVSTYGIPDLANAGALRAMDRYQLRWPYLYDAQEQLYRQGDVYGGHRYGMQTDGDVYLMYYRKDLRDTPQMQDRYAERFGEALVSPRDWAELDRQMSFFHDPQNGRHGGLLPRTPDHLGWEFIARFEAEGLPLCDAEFSPDFLGETAHQVLDAILRSHEYLHPLSASAAPLQGMKIFREGQIYATIGWGCAQKLFNRSDSALRGKLAFAQLPKGQGKGGGFFNGGLSYVLSAATRRPEMAYHFAATAVSPEVSTRALQASGGVLDPFQRAHYRDHTIRQIYSDEFLNIHRQAMQKARPDLYLPGYSNYMATLNKHLYAALSGRSSPLAALTRLQIEWEAVTTNLDPRRQARLYADLRKP